MKRKIKRAGRRFAVLLLLCLVGLMCTSAYAYSVSDGETYEFSFEPPFAGCIETTTFGQPQRVARDGEAFVTRNSSTAQTDYTLYLPDPNIYREGGETT